MADTQTEPDEHESGKGDREEQGSPDRPGADRQAADKKDDDKPGLLERYPIIRYVLIAALVAGGRPTMSSASSWPISVSFASSALHRLTTASCEIRLA